MPTEQIATVHDAAATRDIRAKILSEAGLSEDLATAISKVFKKHGVNLSDDHIVAMEPVVTRRLPDAPNGVKNTVEGSKLFEASHDLSATIHIIETRSLVRNFAVTSSAWL